MSQQKPQPTSILDNVYEIKRNEVENETEGPPRSILVNVCPDRVTNFTRQFAAATKFMKKEDLQLLKNQFLELETKELRKLQVELHKQQEQRKKTFNNKLKQFENAHFKQQQNQKRQEQLNTMATVQDYDERTKEIRDNETLNLEEKLKQLNVLKTQVEKLLEHKKDQ